MLKGKREKHVLSCFLNDSAVTALHHHPFPVPMTTNVDPETPPGRQPPVRVSHWAHSTAGIQHRGSLSGSDVPMTHNTACPVATCSRFSLSCDRASQIRKRIVGCGWWDRRWVSVHGEERMGSPVLGLPWHPFPSGTLWYLETWAGIPCPGANLSRGQGSPTCVLHMQNVH